jgi:hypothetical protein
MAMKPLGQLSTIPEISLRKSTIHLFFASSWLYGDIATLLANHR